MARDQISRVEEFLFRALWLILKAMVGTGALSEKDFNDWHGDYMNAGGGTITPRVDG